MKREKGNAMITKINSTTVQNKTTLQNRNQKSAQNFGMIHFDMVSFQELIKDAEVEKNVLVKELDDKLKYTTAKTSMDTKGDTIHLSFANKAAEFYTDIKQITDQGGPLDKDPQMHTLRENFYKLFEKEHPEINVLIKAKKNDAGKYEAHFITTREDQGEDSRCSNPLGIECSSKNEDFQEGVRDIIQGVEERLKIKEIKLRLKEKKDSITENFNDVAKIFFP